MSMLFNAVSGLRVANTALLVTGQNVSNAAVQGYSRQAAQFGTAATPFSGVDVIKVDRIVNSFLNDDIWRTQSDASYYQGVYTYLGYTEELLGTESLNLNTTIGNLEAALNSAMNSPDNTAYRQQILTEAKGVEQKFSQLSTALEKQQAKLNVEMTSLAAGASSVLEQLAKLNDTISKQQSLGQNTANLMDQRENLVLELSNYVAVDVLEQADGTINISSLNGSPLLIGQQASQLSVAAGQVKIENNLQQFTLTQDAGGRLGGLLTSQAETIEPAMQELSDMAKNLADAMNSAHRQGYDLNGRPGGDIFSYDANNPLGSLTFNDALSPEDLALIGREPDGAGGWQPSGGVGDNGNVAPLIASLAGVSTNYDTLIGDLAIQSQQVQSSIEASDSLNRSAVSARDSVSGVNLDEEAANLMHFKQLYDANAKVISTAGQLFSTLINIF